MTMKMKCSLHHCNLVNSLLHDGMKAKHTASTACSEAVDMLATVSSEFVDVIW